MQHHLQYNASTHLRPGTCSLTSKRLLYCTPVSAKGVSSQLRRVSSVEYMTRVLVSVWPHVHARCRSHYKEWLAAGNKTVQVRSAPQVKTFQQQVQPLQRRAKTTLSATRDLSFFMMGFATCEWICSKQQHAVNGCPALVPCTNMPLNDTLLAMCMMDTCLHASMYRHAAWFTCMLPAG